MEEGGKKSGGKEGENGIVWRREEEEGRERGGDVRVCLEDRGKRKKEV